jgi:hypothetical protein
VTLSFSRGWTLPIAIGRGCRRKVHAAFGLGKHREKPRKGGRGASFVKGSSKKAPRARLAERRPRVETGPIERPRVRCIFLVLLNLDAAAGD